MVRADVRHEIDLSDVKASVHAWIGHALHGDTKGLRRSVLAACVSCAVRRNSISPMVGATRAGNACAPCSNRPPLDGSVGRARYGTRPTERSKPRRMTKMRFAPPCAGPAPDENRVLRGGSWNNNPATCARQTATTMRRRTATTTASVLPMPDGLCPAQSDACAGVTAWHLSAWHAGVHGAGPQRAMSARRNSVGRVPPLFIVGVVHLTLAIRCLLSARGFR